jgi:hypothetical protein
MSFVARARFAREDEKKSVESKTDQSAGWDCRSRSHVVTGGNRADSRSWFRSTWRAAGGHHFIALNMPDEFLKELLARVRPLVATPTR